MTLKYDLTREDVEALVSYDLETGVFKWKVDRGGMKAAKAGDVAGTNKGKGGYWILRLHGKDYRAHRVAFLLVFGKWPVKDVDHINGQRDDNRWSNLREVSRSVNMQNLKSANKDSKTGLLGVTRHQKGFRAQIQVDGKNRHLGTFNTAEEAHQAYLDEKRKLHEGCTL